jgi:hypothetical protein
VSEITLQNCPFCDSTVRLRAGQTAMWVQCDGCGANGPRTVIGDYYAAQLAAAEKWHRRGKFGHARVSIANPLIPKETYVLIERMRENVDRLERGELGTPNQAAVLYYDEQSRVTTVCAERMPPSTLQALLRAVDEARLVRNEILVTT